jgi:predicted ATPase/class 3 adenylate cyclase
VAAQALTFLLTDIEGSTRLLTQLGSERWEEVLRHHARILGGAISRAGGETAHTEGDSFFAVFAAPTDAITAAVSAELDLAKRSWPYGVEVRVRMGIHVGEAKRASPESGADFVGLDVHHAARVASAAYGGQVLLSSATVSAVRGDLPAGVALRDLGVHRLKDLSEPERLYQLVIEGAANDFPPPRTLGRSATALPVQPTSFIGREEEIDEARRALGRAQMLTLVGPGGTGKTRLALQLAAEIADDYDDGIWFVPLDAVTDANGMHGALARALEVRDIAGRTLDDVLMEYLSDRQLLLVLDNFEQAIAAAPAVAALVAAAPRVKVVVTSRAPLRVLAEQQYPVAPLPIPHAADAADPAALARTPSVALFVERALAVRPDFGLTRENSAAIAGICSRLEGLPLAIELCATRVNMLTPQAILRRLDRSLELLSGGASDLPARQRTLRSTISWSYDLLEPSARLLFERLSVFTGGATLQLIEEVCGDGPIFDDLASLVEQSLIQQREVSAEPRYSMLATIREFANERLDAGPHAEVTRRRHAAAFLQLAERAEAELDGPREGDWIKRLEIEHDNYRTSLEWARVGDPSHGLKLATLLSRFWTRRGYQTEGREWIEAMLAATPPDDPARPRALYEAGWLAMWAGEHARAAANWAEAIELSRMLGDRATLADTLSAVVLERFLSVMSADRRDYSEVKSLLGETLVEQRTLGNVKAEAASMYFLALCLYLEGWHAQALPIIEESIELRRRIGDESGEVETLPLFAMTIARLGRVRDAAELFDRALTIQSGHGNPAHTFFALSQVGAFCVLLGRHREALLLHGASDTIAVELGIAGPAVSMAGIMADAAAARLALGSSAYAVEAEGRSLSMAQAAELARGILADARE